MAAGRRRRFERLDGLRQAGEDVRRAQRLDPGYGTLEIADPTERLGLHDPVGGVVERDDPELVARGHRRCRPQDRLLADVDLANPGDPGAGAAGDAVVERVAVAGVHRARLVDDDDQRDVGLLLLVADTHVDRQALLDRRLLEAAGAEGLRAADHHEALAEIADVDLEGGHLVVAEPGPRDVDEDDAVVGREPGEIGRERLRNGRIDLLVLRLQGGDELRRDLVVAGQDEDPRLPLHDRVRVRSVVLAERVPGGLDDGPECVETGLFRCDEERHLVGSGLEVQPLGRNEAAVRVEPDRRGLGDARADLGDGFELLADAGGRRGSQSLDHDLVRCAAADDPGLDLDASRSRERGLRLTLSGGVVPVRQQDDPLLGVVGEEGSGESKSGSNVGRRPNRRRRDPVDLAHLARQSLDERVLAEADDPGDVALGNDGETLPNERQGVLSAGRADGIGQVHDEHGRQPIDRQDEAEAGECEYEGRDQTGPYDEADAPSPPAGSSASGRVQDERQPERRNEQEQGERRVDGTAHFSPAACSPVATVRPAPGGRG